jgi:hypothetical protein
MSVGTHQFLVFEHASDQLPSVTPWPLPQAPFKHISAHTEALVSNVEFSEDCPLSGDWLLGS